MHCSMSVLFFILIIQNCVAVPLQWSILPVSETRPSARQDGFMAYDSSNGGDRLYLFGGKEHDEATGNWTWTELEIPESSRPPARFGMVGGVTEINSETYFVICTGDNGSFRFNDVWVLRITGGDDTLAWTEIGTSGDIPSPRYGSIGGIRKGGEQLYLSHGFDAKRYSDTFSLDLKLIGSGTAAWTLLHDNINPYNPRGPHSRCLGAGTVTKDSEIVLFGGCLTGGKSGGPCPSNDGWVFDQDKRWSRTSNEPAAGLFNRMVYMNNGDRVLLYGGKQSSNQVLTIAETSDDELNFLNVKTGDWDSYTSQGQVPQRRENTMLDAFTIDGEDVVLTWGGKTSANGNFNTDLYLLSGNSDAAPTGASHPWFTIWMLHGIFMFLGWGICLQMGAFIARYFRHKDPFWFKFHRALQMAGLALATIGIILGFISASTAAASHFTFTHSVLGLIIMIIGWFQPVNAYFRPHIGEKYREIWSFFHKNLGRSALVLALVNITLGLFMAVVVEAVWIIWFIILSGFVVTYLVFEFKLRTKFKKEIQEASAAIESPRNET